MLGLIGVKEGMSRLQTATGDSIAVTLISAPPNPVIQVKTEDKDGYFAVQVAANPCKKSSLNKPRLGHLQKAGEYTFKTLAEFRLPLFGKDKLGEAPKALDLSQFAVGQRVDVAGVSKGRGFAGTVRRWNFATQDATHGNSRAHRVPGSIGNRKTPGRVFKGKKMAGRMGGKKLTATNLEVAFIDRKANLIAVKGSVPGPTGSLVKILTRSTSPKSFALEKIGTGAA